VSVAGLILAAGESKRMGSPKALLEIQGETFLDRLTRIFSPFCSPVVVVVGAQADEIRSGVKRPERSVVAENANYQLGQLSSMQCGLRMLPETIDGVLFTLVDHPNVAASTIAALLEEPRPLLAIPRFQERRGHPIYFGGELVGEFLSLPPDSQAKVVISRHSESVRWVDVDDPGILDDVDDPAAYRRLLEIA
jgi:CTP:molybdopterin cytidylyltransferase MocA